MKVSSVCVALLIGVTFSVPGELHAKPHGGGGGGGSPCPTNTLAFSPTTSTDLQQALDCAAAGATITLSAGTVYAGNFTLRYKSGYDGTAAKRVTIQSSALSSLPAGRRVSPSDCRIPPCGADDGLMAWLQVASGASAPVLVTELVTLADGVTRRAASGYQIAGIKLFSTHWVNHLVQLGTGTEQRVSELPTDITFDRSYFAGSAGEGSKQGLVANGVNVVVSNSYFKNFKDTANDAQAISVWNGAGPFQIQNNYLEGSGENIMSGGGDPTIANLIPSDFTIIGNYLYKPTAWTTETSTQKGSTFGKTWRIKNLFELKNAQRVLIEGNVLENNWIQADQWGFAVLFGPRNQSGGCGWCTVQNVTFQNNVIRNSIAGVKLLATDDTYPSGQLQGVKIFNNLLVNINANAVPGTNPGDRAGRLIQVMNPYPAYSSKASPTGPINVTVDHNTAFSTREDSYSVWDPTGGFNFTNNVARHNTCADGSNDCGMSGDGTAPGNAALSYWFASPTCGAGSAPPCGVLVAGNILFDAGVDRTAEYPSGNSFPFGTLPFYPYAFKSSCDGSNPIDLTTGKPTNASSPADYNVVTAADSSCATFVLASDGSGKVGADWDVVKAKSDAAIGGTTPP